VSAAGRPCSPGEAPHAVNFLNLLNFRGIRKSRKIASQDGLGGMGVPAYTTGHRERYLAYGSRPPPWRSRVSRHKLIDD
jgi:hypothetical protein